MKKKTKTIYLCRSKPAANGEPLDGLKACSLNFLNLRTSDIFNLGKILKSKKKKKEKKFN